MEKIIRSIVSELSKIRKECEGGRILPRHIITLSENDIAKIINGEEVQIDFKQTIKSGERIIIRQSCMKDIAVDMLVRKNRVMNTASNTFEY